MVESRNNGVPLLTQAPKAKITRCIEQLADMLDSREVEDTAVDEKKKRKGLFKFLSASSR